MNDTYNYSNLRTEVSFAALADVELIDGKYYPTITTQFNGEVERTLRLEKPCDHYGDAYDIAYQWALGTVGAFKAAASRFEATNNPPAARTETPNEEE